jgi:hypothetical protein
MQSPVLQYRYASAISTQAGQNNILTRFFYPVLVDSTKAVIMFWCALINKTFECETN